MSRVVKYGTKWLVAYKRGDRFIIPAHIGNAHAPLAYVGSLEEFGHLGYVYAREADALKRARDLFPYINTTFERKAA